MNADERATGDADAVGLACAPEPATVVAVGGSVAVADAHHRELFGQHWLEGAHSVLDAISQVSTDAGTPAVITVLDTRPEVWLEAATAAFDGSLGRGFDRLVIVAAHHSLVVVETLAEADLPVALAVDAVSWRRGRSVTGFRRRDAGDLPLTPLLTGLRNGLEPSVLTVRDRIVSAPSAPAEPMDQDGGRVREPEAAVTASAERADALTAEVEQLRSREAALAAELATARKRYASLSNSLLGGAALKYWAWRRKWRR